MNYALFITAIAFAVIGFTMFLLFGFLSQKGAEKRYDLLCDFPNELPNPRHPISTLSRIGYLSFSLSFLALALSSFSSAFPGLTSLFLFLSASIGISAASRAIMVFVPASKTKAHTGLALLEIIFGTLTSFLSGLIAFSFREDKFVFAILFAILFWTLALAYLVLLLNPKLASWPRMKLIETANGSYLEKPRPFVLAFSEWIVIGLDALFFILFALLILIPYL